MLELDGYWTENLENFLVDKDRELLWGRAIVRQPAVFLFDEPLSNLDAKLRIQNAS